tara:strand:+ start:1027 stop:2667 length:1641 start_codon:yes stop_codon:yes gene_type:complete
MRNYDLALYIDGNKITDVKKIEIKRSSDMKMSKAEITLKNANLKHINTLSTDFIQLNQIDMDSTVEIYADYKVIPDNIRTGTSSDIVDQRLAALLFNGNVTKIELNNTNNKTDIKLIATDSMLLLMNKVRIANFSNTSITDILINLVQQAFGPGYTNYEIPAGLPNKDYYATHRPLHEHILKISGTDYTGYSRNAIFKLIPDPGNTTYPYKFIWQQPEDAASTTLNGAINSTDTSIILTNVTGFPSEGAITIDNEVIRYTSISGTTLTVAQNGRGFGSTVPASHSDGAAVSSVMTITTGKDGPGVKKLSQLKVSKSEDKAVNMLIMRLGRDLFDRTITHYAYDVHSETKGLRMKIVDWRYVAEDYKRSQSGGQTSIATDFSSDTGTLVLTDGTVLGSSGTKYIEVLVEGNTEIIEGTYSGSGNNFTIASATDRGQFNTAITRNLKAGTIVRDITDLVALGNTVIRTNIKDLARNEYAQEFFRFQNPRWTAKVLIEGANISPLGLVNLTAQDIGVNSFPLRIKDITHSLGKSTWTTNINLEEDELKT